MSRSFEYCEAPGIARVIPVLAEGEEMPTAAEYAEAERLTAIGARPRDSFLDMIRNEVWYAQKGHSRASCRMEPNDRGAVAVSITIDGKRVAEAEFNDGGSGRAWAYEQRAGFKADGWCA